MSDIPQGTPLSPFGGPPASLSLSILFPLPRPRVLRTRRRTVGTLHKMWEIGNGEWAPTLRHYNWDGTPKANISELRQFRWCKYMDTREGEPLLGQGRSDRWKDHLVFAPGPIDPDSREWGGPGMVQNMEQFLRFI